jgi:hypothetical protein
MEEWQRHQGKPRPVLCLWVGEVVGWNVEQEGALGFYLLDQLAWLPS